MSPFESRRFLLACAISPFLLLACSARAQAQALTDGVYTLVAKTSSLALDNEGANGPNPVWQWGPLLGNTNQEWKIKSLSNGDYSVTSVTSGLVLDNGGTDTDGTPTQQAVPSATSTRQRWQILSLGGGYYQLINVASGKALDNSGATASGGSVWQWDANPGNINQAWLIAPVQIGAKTPFTSLEAESGTLASGATVVSLTAPPSTEFSSPELEASGHSYVHLAGTGQQVSWTNTTGQAITAINVRYSIPDAPSGGGIASTLDLYVNGVFRQALAVNSKQTWLYEDANDYDGMSKDPSVGNPHVFWDETHAFIAGVAVAPGSTITLRKDAANNAAYYNVDVVDLETPPAPLAQPANSLSITSCGAVANDSTKDSTTAIQSCINTAQSQGESVWIPQGTFYLNNPNGLSAQGITIQGAGMWYSTIYYNPPLPAPVTNNVILPTSVTLKNFAIDGNAIGAGAGQGNGGAINIKGTGWLIDSLWIQHEGAGIWADGTNGTVQNCRLNNTWADGINLNNGNGGPGNGTGNNLTAFNNHVRGSGDDGLAINDGLNPGGQPMQNITLLQNTVVAPWWANDIGVYGASNSIVANNLATDSVKEFGISVGVFGAGDPVVSAWIEGNTVLRGGSHGYGNQYPGIGVGVTGTPQTVQNVTARGNTVIDAMFDGLQFQQGGTNITIQNTLVQSPGLNGFLIQPQAQGDASFLYNTALDISSGESAYVNDATAQNFSDTGTGNVGFVIP